MPTSSFKAASSAHSMLAWEMQGQRSNLQYFLAIFVVVVVVVVDLVVVVVEGDISCSTLK